MPNPTRPKINASCHTVSTAINARARGRFLIPTQTQLNDRKKGAFAPLARHLDIFGPVGANYVGSRQAADGSVLCTKTGPKRPVLSLFGGGRRPQTRYCYIGLLTPVNHGRDGGGLMEFEITECGCWIATGVKLTCKKCKEEKE